jgi:hypothetical protein
LDRLQRASAQAVLGEALFEQDRQLEARQAFQTALAEALPDAKGSTKPNKGQLKCAARIYLTCPDPSIRDPKRAAELAEKAGDWKLLAHALYKQGQLEAAWKVLREKWPPREPENPVQWAKRWLLQALCLWRLKRLELAWHSYRVALDVLEKTRPVSRELRALRAEADQFARRFPPPAKK